MLIESNKYNGVLFLNNNRKKYEYFSLVLDLMRMKIEYMILFFNIRFVLS